ncbi:MAG: hypothetical protein WBG37_10900 [Desulfobacterales bacterium]
MNNGNLQTKNVFLTWPQLAQLPNSGKMLVTIVIVALSLGMAGALGQIVVHDIIPTFFSVQANENPGPQWKETTGSSGAGERGDLFGDLDQKSSGAHSSVPSGPSSEQFVWLLKWTHIHLFGMTMIFIFVGGITLFLNLKDVIKTWLVILPFIGVWLDIGAMWLKAYVSSHFFWLHIPGGGLFGSVFGFVALQAIWEMWGQIPLGGQCED